MATGLQPDTFSCCAGPGIIPDELFNDHEFQQQENILTKKMQNLSPEEREQGIQHLHGLLNVIEETEEMVIQKLKEFDLELKKIPNSYALDLAKSKSLDYVMDMRLMFLRSEGFDAKESAAKIVRFFEMKLGLFGEEKLVKDVTYWDLTTEDQQFLDQGGLQLLSLRDRAGRVVLFRVAVLFAVLSVESQGRLLYFVVMKGLEDEEIQKRGIVFVMYNIGIDTFFTKGASANVARFTALPLLLGGIHLCYDNPILEKLTRLTHFLLPKKHVSLFRPHFGSHQECLYALMTFGIIREVIPITATGEVNLEFHKIWLKRIITAEPIQDNEESKEIGTKKIIIPGPMDIILGRGSHAKNSPGNLRFKHLLETHRRHYDSLNKRERKAVTHSLLGELKESGVRFIKRDGQGGYMEIPEIESIAKISHGFRNLRTHVESSNASRVEKNSKKKRSSTDSDGNFGKRSSTGGIVCDTGLALPDLWERNEGGTFPTMVEGNPPTLARTAP